MDYMNISFIKNLFSSNWNDSKDHPKNVAYLFDADGVLTDPEAKKITRPDVINHLAKRLQMGRTIGINTGRSLEFIQKEILSPLESAVGDKSILHNIFALAEKGAIWISYNEAGIQKVFIDSEISIPTRLKKTIREIAELPKYRDIVFFDETKNTMCSIELRPGKTLEEFNAIRVDLLNDLKEMLLQDQDGKRFRAINTSIAFDIENLITGKDLGARRFIKLLSDNGIKPEKYLCFGDSESDYAMHEELIKMNKSSQFIFVGKPEDLENKSLQDVTFTNSRFDAGTLEYLESESI